MIPFPSHGILRGKNRAWLLCCALLAAGAVSGRAQESSAAGDSTPEVSLIRHYDDFWDLPGDQHQLAHPVDLEGDVVYVDPGWRMMFIQMGSWAHYLSTGEDPITVRPGQRVRVTGQITPARGPRWQEIKLEVIGASPPRALPELDVLSDTDRAHVMTAVARGLVNRQELTDPTHLFVEVAHRGATFPMRVWMPEGAPVPDFVGSYIQARGVFNPQGSGTHGSSGFEFLVASSDSVERIGWLATDPAFDQPPVPIGELGGMAPDVEVGVVGVVRAQAPGRSITLWDESGQVEVLTGQTAPAPLGQSYQARGLPRSDGIRLILRDGRYRPATGRDAVPKAHGLPTLRMANQVLALSKETAEEGGPVRLVGAVAWSHPDVVYLHVLDSTGGVRVRRSEGMAVPQVGTMVAIEGTTAYGDFAPMVSATRFETVGSVSLPDARDVTYEQILTGMEDSQWVAVRGLVRDVVSDGSWTRLEISTPGGDLEALAPHDDSIQSRIGAIVRARGICTVHANARQQLAGVRLWLRGADDLQVEEAAPADPFAPGIVPRVAIGGLRRFSTMQTANRRIRITGTVTHHQAGRYFYVQDAADAIQVLTRGAVPLSPGDQVEAVGLPGSDGQRLVLREAVYRRSGAGRRPIPARIDELLTPNPAYESRLVSLQARLLERAAGARDVRLVLERGGVIFEARLTATDPASDVTLEPQSRVELTGIYSVVHDEYRQPSGFVLQLRSAADILVLEAPPWLNARRAAALSGVSVVLILLGLGWVQSLRRRVRKQTGQIREQLASEAELKARQRDILENANDCIFTTDLGGRITAFNRAGERLTGYTRTDAIQLHLRDLFAGAEDGALALAQLRSEDGGGATFQTRFRRKDGGIVWVEVSSRLVSVDGRPTGLLGIVHDMTERRKFEDELSAARDAAQASAAAKGSFLANMSHEIRTPMNGVIGMANLLLDTPLAREQRDFAETIRDSADGLLTILNDILDFSKIEAGKLRFESEPFDLAATIDGALELMASRAAARRLALAACVPRAVPTRLVGDPGRLRQVLLNLVGNAIKFTETGEVIVQVACVSRTPQQVMLRFEVIDSGPGMSDEAQARMFKPFEQADSSTTRRFGGTGLGLAISRQIVGLMDGEIGVRSRLGEGSTFWFTARFACEPAPAEESSPVTLGDGRVLVVEANTATRRILADHLAAWDATVVTAAGAEEALATARVAADDRRAFDLALVDHDTLGSDGIAAFCTALRALPGGAHVRVLGMVPIDRRSGLAPDAGLGVVGMISKPVRRDGLIEAVRHALAGGEMVTPPAPASIAPESAALSAPAVASVAPAPAASPTPLVLVVEDNIVNQRVARLLLGKMGVRIDVAGNGFEAIQALERTSYAAVFMDCQMPEMDGYEATTRIRADGRHEGLRIIAMTANAMQGDRQRCLASGMDDYISKPIRPDELRAALERADVLAPLPPESGRD